MAATVEESTPPDMATAMVLEFVMLRVNNCLPVRRRQLPQPCHRIRHQRKREVNIFRYVLFAKAEADASPRPIGPEPHRQQHMGGLNRTRRTGGARRNRQALEVERN